MGRVNNSSIDEELGMRIAALGQQRKKAAQDAFQMTGENPKDQVVNGNKAKHLATAKAKERAKKKSKMAKASRKKNK
jgi:hypothetical protein